MKFKVLLFLSLLFTHLSCVKQVTTNENSSSFVSLSSKSYPVHIEINNSDSTYFERDIYIDLNLENFEDNSGPIIHSVDALQLKLSNFEGSETARCDFQFSYMDSISTIGSPLSYGNVPLYEFSQTGNILNINHSKTTLSLVSNSIMANRRLILRIKGQLNEKPLKFDAKFDILIKSRSI